VTFVQVPVAALVLVGAGWARVDLISQTSFAPAGLRQPRSSRVIGRQPQDRQGARPRITRPRCSRADAGIE
jgi:hypothetical protein